MPGTTSGSPQPGTAVPWSGPAGKGVAPAPPGGSGSRTGSASEAVRETNSRNYPDVAAGITDIYDPEENEHRAAGDGDTVVPDYPMDSLPRHASTRSLPATTNGQQTSSGSGPVVRRSHPPESSRPSGPRSSPRTLDPPQTIISSLSTSSTGNIPPAAVIARIPSQVPAQVHPASHSTPTTIPPSVSHSNVSVSVSHTGPVPVHGDPRQIRTQDLNIGVVARLDNQRQGASILPDLVTGSQPPAPARQVSSPQALRPLSDPRLAQQREHRHIVDPHARHRHHRDRRHGRSHRHTRRHSYGTDSPCTESCYKCLAVGLSFRWILVVLSLLGVCCVVTGIILAALHAAGNSFLFLAIMFIGLGVLLVVVVGVGWKCTPRGHEPLHALFNLGDFRRRSRRPRERRRRDGRWYGGAMYPEFQYRRPPPSYNASMQEYQQQLAAQQSQGPDLYDPDNIPDEDYSLPSSPPPSYRSRASTVRAGIQITFPPNQGGDYPDSRPPTYRSHPSNTLQGRHSRPSLSRDDDDDTDEAAPADVAFTGSSVIVDTSTSQNSTSIQISPAVASNQNVTVSVTTVSVTTSPPTASALNPPLEGQRSVAAPTESVDSSVDPVGEGDADRVETAL